LSLRTLAKEEDPGSAIVNPDYNTGSENLLKKDGICVFPGMGRRCAGRAGSKTTDIGPGHG